MRLFGVDFAPRVCAGLLVAAAAIVASPAYADEVAISCQETWTAANGQTNSDSETYRIDVAKSTVRWQNLVFPATVTPDIISWRPGATFSLDRATLHITGESVIGGKTDSMVGECAKVQNQI